MASSLPRAGQSVRQQLILFSRFPEPGSTKTRLVGALGAAGAAELQKAMTEHVLERVAPERPRSDLELCIQHAGGDRAAMQRWLGPRFAYREQGSGDLGARMARAFADGFAAGFERVVIIGSDCPDLSREGVDEALAALEQRDVVFGPARDGGYYLVGIRRAGWSRARQALLSSIPWGTDRVLATSRRQAGQADLSVALLRILADVDRPEDLPVWERASTEPAGVPAPSTLSVIIPALDEASQLGRSLAAVRADDDVELIVVDGGSSDDTVAVAEAHGATVLRWDRGRAAQLNTGAAAASGGTLLFLHADTVLPAGYGSVVSEALRPSEVVGGAFSFRTDLASPAMELVERLANWRSRVLGMPYGDQGLFVRAGEFRRLGGFNEWPILDDLDLVLRLRQVGQVVTVPVPAVTSGRRWRRHGVARVTVVNQAMLVGFALGLAPRQLARFYRRVGRARRS